jgi:alkyl sulfatase BDS1-like metallo-beta-lactamase superfamily hydrolase
MALVPRARLLRWFAGLVLLLLALGVAFVLYTRPARAPVPVVRGLATPERLARQCADAIGPPRVLTVTDRVLVAVGYDLANTILIRTAVGNVIVDAGMSPARAAPVRDALLAAAPGPVVALIYTHSHIDHVGGASVWASPATDIWATEAFVPHFIKQYGAFRAAEGRRGASQFGRHVAEADLPCSALGRRPDLDAAATTGARLPTRTFRGARDLEIGGVKIHLREAHGETHDHLFVHLPDDGVLLAGDNFYQAFPNLYTLRGTTPRPIDAWIASLDAMRRLAPDHLVPSHTLPVSGRDVVAGALTRYRDAIQWVRDGVVRLANAGRSVDQIVEELGLPPAIAGAAELAELYGQVDWSARAIYNERLGWFDERPETLYPLARADRASRLIDAMGGPQAVLTRIDAADDPRWAVELLAVLRDAGEPVAPRLADALEVLATDVGNSNGRAYLLEEAHALRSGRTALPTPPPDPALLDALPVAHFFEVMATRLDPGLARDVHESVRFEFSDTGERFVLTIRYGIAELVVGDPLPGTPEPLAVVRTTTATWRRLAVGLEGPLPAVAAGRLVVDGDAIAFRTFSERFVRGL